MNKYLWSCAALLTLFVTAESLICNTCDVTALGTCLGDVRVNCTGDQNRCYSGVAQLSNGLLDIYSRGCRAEKDCKNTTGSILDVKYTITLHCCSTDLCNGAASVRLPVAAALGAALVAVWNQWGL